MDNYIKKYDSLEKKLVFVFQLGQGGIGDCIKFFMQSLYYSIKYDIKLYYFKSDITIEKYLKLKHDKMYFTEGFDKLVKTDYSSLSNLEPNIYHFIYPSDLYFQPLNVHLNFDELFIIKDVFYLSDEVIINKNLLMPSNIDNYISVHLRLGDKYLETDKAFVFCANDERAFNEERMLNYIEDNIETHNIIFFCDNNSYKIKMKEKFDKIIILNSNIGHTSLSNTSEQQTLDSLAEFYIMANSDMIYAASHSGFSIMASKFNNIPLWDINSNPIKEVTIVKSMTDSITGPTGIVSSVTGPTGIVSSVTGPTGIVTSVIQENLCKKSNSKLNDFSVSSKMIILVTGGTGMVGSAIQEISSEYSNYNFIFISSKDYDLTDMDSTNNMFLNHKPDFIIHLAACVGGLFKNMNQKIDMFEKNLLINYNVVKCCYLHKVKKMIACLSTCIFPDKITYPINEGMLHEGPPHNSNDAYAYAKRMLEVQCRLYRENHGCDFVCVIPTNIYGKNDNFSLEDGHVLPALINKCYLAKKAGSDFIVKGTGKPLRQFIYSTDLAKLMMNVLTSDKKINNITLSVSEDDEVSIETVARTIARSFDYEHRIVFDSSYSDGQYKKTVSNEKILDLYPNFEFTKIEDGIKSTVEWFMENIHKIRS